MYCIVDLETTGGKAQGHKIIEVALILHDGKKVIEEFSSLIHPERNLPPFISSLTGITEDMLDDAPKFYEVAKRIYEMTQNTILVAHNAHFDYGFLRKEYLELGMDYRRPTLCTVRLSRRHLPGLPSYNLGQICKSLSLPLENRHRALGDARATALLWEKLLTVSSEIGSAEGGFTPEGKKAPLPPQFDTDTLLNIPELPGIYRFHDRHGKILYIGKSKNLSKRVQEHLRFPQSTEKIISGRGSSTKAEWLRLQAQSVSFETTGSELVALLRESQEIKKHSPEVNRRLRSNAQGVTLYLEGLEGPDYARLKITKGEAPAGTTILCFSSLRKAQKAIESYRERFILCACFNTPHQKQISCKELMLLDHGTCLGACEGRETPATYNVRAYELLKRMSYPTPDFVILEEGRRPGEWSFVLVEEGIYQGYGFTDLSEPTVQQLRRELTASLIEDPDRDAKGILLTYLRTQAGRKKMFPLSALAAQFTTDHFDEVFE